jgi:nitrile hydratase accessory protein
MVERCFQHPARRHAISRPADRQVSNMEGDAALPRSNGELLFEAPWEGRAFGIAVVLNEDGRYEWREFRDQLVAEIAAEEAAATESSYYERWLASLERLAVAKGLVTEAELETRTAEYASGQREGDDH